jgi:hypothetical protein
LAGENVLPSSAMTTLSSKENCTLIALFSPYNCSSISPKLHESSLESRSPNMHSAAWLDLLASKVSSVLLLAIEHCGTCTRRVCTRLSGAYSASLLNEALGEPTRRTGCHSLVAAQPHE